MWHCLAWGFLFLFSSSYIFQWHFDLFCCKESTTESLTGFFPRLYVSSFHTLTGVIFGVETRLLILPRASVVKSNLFWAHVFRLEYGSQLLAKWFNYEINTGFYHWCYWPSWRRLSSDSQATIKWRSLCVDQTDSRGGLFDKTSSVLTECVEEVTVALVTVLVRQGAHSHTANSLTLHGGADKLLDFETSRKKNIATFEILDVISRRKKHIAASMYSFSFRIFFRDWGGKCYTLFEVFCWQGMALLLSFCQPKIIAILLTRWSHTIFYNVLWSEKKLYSPNFLKLAIKARWSYSSFLCCCNVDWECVSVFLKNWGCLTVQLIQYSVGHSFLQKINGFVAVLGCPRARTVPTKFVPRSQQCLSFNGFSRPGSQHCLHALVQVVSDGVIKPLSLSVQPRSDQTSALPAWVTPTDATLQLDALSRNQSVEETEHAHCGTPTTDLYLVTTTVSNNVTPIM